MAQRSHVPKFGNWESEENVPYTAYFDKARKGRSGSPMRNPNDPQEYADAISGDKSPAQAPVLKTGAEPDAAVIPGAVRPKHERRSSREDGDLRRSSDSPARYDNVVRKTGDSRTGRKSGGSSIEQSPIHPHQARVSGKGTGVSSPSWERKGSSEHNHGLAPATPVRSRLRTGTRGDETLDKGAAVPKFGEWDEKDPASADGYTHIFNIVREERQGGGGPGRVPVMPSSSDGHRRDNDNDSTAACCFGWCRK